MRSKEQTLELLLNITAHISLTWHGFHSNNNFESENSLKMLGNMIVHA